MKGNVMDMQTVEQPPTKCKPQQRLDPAAEAGTGFTHISKILPQVLELIELKATLEQFIGDPHPWHAELSRQLDRTIDDLDQLSESRCLEPWH
ncbi:MAG: hypothetical protein ABI684_14565 [Nitrospirota bacterium]